MADNWQVIEQEVDAAGQVLRRQVIDVGLPEDEARIIAEDMQAGHVAAVAAMTDVEPHTERRFVYVAEEAV